MVRIDYLNVDNHLINPDTKFQWEGCVKQIAEIKKGGDELQSRLSPTRDFSKSKTAEMPVSELAEIILRYQNLSKVFKHALAECIKLLLNFYKKSIDKNEKLSARVKKMRLRD